ncbi:hypothetical protein HQN90_20360 [Paenibacillus alba]|uniref:hypothetical protein n=1 Tax=Paenibacillus alba TaxID=1197127 RepID=UPI0015668650|nr:hypothetical protein [Paenibacillus alba]NQX68482.1 hypothetical protein [Paenibacillus alba]
MPPRRSRGRRANVEVTESTLLPAIIAKLRKLAKQEVHIGAQGDEELAMIAGVLEHGSQKMKIPARSFIGTGKKKSTTPISKLVRQGVNDIAYDRISVNAFLKEIGELGKERTLKNFDKIRKPPLSPIYAKRKGSKKIMVLEKALRDSITFIVVNKGG